MGVYPIQGGPTSFQDIYDRFLGKITDDMYFELTPQDTERDLGKLLIDAIPKFEFPRFPLYDYDESLQSYNVHLTSEEINILALIMLESWLQRQISSIENTRMKYSGPDFKMTSQANHLAKLLALKDDTAKEITHMQRLYKRRRQISPSGAVKSNWSTIMENGVFGINPNAQRELQIEEIAQVYDGGEVI